MTSVVLGIDTSGNHCSVALARRDVLFERRLEVGSAHAEHLLDMVHAVLDDGHIRLPDCDAIAFSAGPGSFTGLRVACAVTQGLAFGAGVRVAPVGTLDAIAWSVRDEAPDARRLLVMQDARMDEVYWSLLEHDGTAWRERVPASLDPVAGVAARVATVTDLPVSVGCGNAWSIHGDALAGLADAVIHRDGADAVAVAQLGQRAHAEGRLVDAADARPLYVRDRVALTTDEREAKRRERDQAVLAS